VRITLTRTTLAVAVAAACTLSATTIPATAAAAKAANSWPQTDGNAAGSRSNLAETTLTTAAVRKLHLLRSYIAPAKPPTRKDGYCGNYSSPIVSGGMVTADRNGYLVRFDPATGHKVWRRYMWDLPGHVNPIVTSLAAGHGRIVVAYRHCKAGRGVDASILAVRAKTGKILWHTRTVPGGGNDGLMSAVEVSGRYVITEGNSASPGAVTVHKLSDGSTVWSDTTSSCKYGHAVVVDRLVVYTRCKHTTTSDPGDPGILGRALATGDYTWHQPGVWSVERGDTDAAGGQHVFARTPSAKVADVVPTTGKVRGTLDGAAHVVAVDGNQAYASCGTPNGIGDAPDFCAYSLGSRALAWDVPEGFADFATVGAPPVVAVAAEVLYVGNGDVLAAATGQAIESAATSEPLVFAANPTTSALAVAGGRLIVSPGDPREVDLYGLKGE
jgi:hypothetical protein